MRVMVTGARGLLAAAIAHEFASVGEVHPFDRQALEISDVGAINAAVDTLKPQVVINCAAFNDVDGAEDNAQAALATNALGVKALAEAAARVGAVLVHYSTDFVFDGETNRPYAEDDQPRPLSVYGTSKLLGEWLALQYPRSYVLRVESLFGTADGVQRRGSMQTIADRICAGEEIPVFVDRTVSPAYTADIASATRTLTTGSAPPGLYHCVNSGVATWLQIAEELASLLNRPLRAKPLQFSSVALRAARPRYSALSTSKLASVGVLMPPWQSALARWLKTLTSSGAIA